MVAVDLRGHGASAQVPDVEPDATAGRRPRPRRGVRRPRLDGAGRRGSVVGRQRRAAARGRSAAARDRAGRRRVAAALRPLRHDRRRLGRPRAPAVRRAHRRGPPRPAALRPSRAGRTRRSRPRWATCRCTSTARWRPGSPASGTARSSTACSRTGRGSCTRRSGARRCSSSRAAGNPAAAAAAAAMPHAELVAFPGGDHDLHAQHPGRGRRAHRTAGVNGRLVIMGSGETAPTMVEVHRATLRAAGEGPSLLLDTPYGFQENADDITEQGRGVLRAQRRPHGRRRSSGAPGSTGPRSTGRSPPSARPRSVFAGPGSPTYALRVWAGTGFDDALAARRDVRRHGDVRERRRADDRRRHRAGLRDLQERRRPRVGAGHEPAGAAHRPARGADPALRQHRGRHPLHPVLLPGRAAAAVPGGLAARRVARHRRGRAHRAGLRPRHRHGERCWATAP